MLAALCARPKAWLSVAQSLSHLSSTAHIQNRFLHNPISRSVVSISADQRCHRSCRCECNHLLHGGVASIWHVILPAGRTKRRNSSFIHHHHGYESTKRGEGSWNAAWDARPARWLHNPDSAWLLFGVCACLTAPPPQIVPVLDLPGNFSEDNGSSSHDKCERFDSNDVVSYEVDHNSVNNYKVKGVPADGRCLFRAIAHMACSRNGEEILDENRQRELADELRAQVVDELLRRRKEAEWFIEGDFDSYVKRIQQPYVWGGEPELLMASHVLKTPIAVFMIDRRSGCLTKIADYGEEYKNDEESSINVLFHGYGHYDILEPIQ